MSDSEDDAIGRRETAYRLFASEFEDSDFSYAESDEERAPNYVVTPTGGRVNRLFVVGVLTEVQPVGEDVLRARVVDPTGAFVVYAGQYQPDAQTFLERADPPTFVAVSGKARTFQPEDSDLIYTSIRPESVNEVDAETRDRWVLQATEQTLDRIGAMAAALESDMAGEALADALETAGLDEALAAGIPLAIDHYGTGGRYLSAVRETALDAARVVAGDLDEVDVPSTQPDAAGDADLDALASIDIPEPEQSSAAAEPAVTAPGPDSGAADSRVGTAGETPTTESPSSDAEASADTSATESTGGADESEDTTATTESTATEATTSASSGGGTDTASTADDATATATEETPTGEDGPAEDTSTATEDTATAGETETVEGADAADAGSEGPGDFDPGEFELDEETREEVESEYGTDFQSGTEVDEPGEADIETPDPEDLEEAAGAGAPADAAESEPAADDTPSADQTSSETTAATTDTEDESEATAAADTDADTEAVDEDVDIEDAVMDAMRELDDGDGAEREAIVESVGERTGADPDAVEGAIQDALMNGRCYEPDDATLKPI